MYKKIKKMNEKKKNKRAKLSKDIYDENMTPLD